MDKFTQRDMIYEGKAKRLYSTDDPNIVVVEYKDSFTAFNGEKRAEMSGKGRLNNLISSEIFGYLAENGVPLHFIEKTDDLRQLAVRVKIFPLEVVVRNITTGSIVKRLGAAEGMKLPRPLIEFYYKDDALGDPIVTEDHAMIFGWASEEDLARIKKITLDVNGLLKKLFEPLGVALVDFKLEFGRDSKGALLLADEISPDTCRFWDSSTGDRLDKDRFRKDLGNVMGAYEEIWKRLSGRKK
ncbi:MAG: phosphoribosylaminoimidazolesuccinocarboxamide synthase [Synergistaceae bacterium]|jgi:phosphoribosylaminoimidazole-succinocarboxamide synthase|nr:phosphoribosylaminoimidazolesuccinocarboxamide synthase [Synergistaceae bacterium]